MSPAEWERINQERCRLIRKQVDGEITGPESERLAELNRVADRHLEETAPRDFSVIDDLKERLRLS